MRRRVWIFGIVVSLLAGGTAGSFLGHRHASSRARLFEVALVADELVHATVALEHANSNETDEARALLKNRITGAATRLDILLKTCPPGFGACQKALSGLTYLSQNPELIRFSDGESFHTNDKVKLAIESAIQKARLLRDQGLRKELCKKYPDKTQRERAFRKVVERTDTQNPEPYFK